MDHRKLSPAALHRAAGVLLGTAAGDALGAGYEFKPPVGDDVAVVMAGGGMWEPGEWTDDTAMALAIAEAAADGADLRSTGTHAVVARRWHEWSLGSKDVGSQTRSVLNAAAASEGGLSAASMTTAARVFHERAGRSAGNGSLMRTAPVALAFLDDETGLVGAARTISALTHFDPDAADACVLWCLAIRHAVLTGEVDVRVGIAHLPEGRREGWLELLEVAERSRPRDFAESESRDGKGNGWVVKALQGAWSAISTTEATTEAGSADHLRAALEEAVRGGDDADTVAAIAGGLLGAAYGASAVPAKWRRILHGWPGLRSRDLISLAIRIARGGSVAEDEWPLVARFDYSGWGDVGAFAAHPQDPDLLMSGVGHLEPLPEGVDAVVSLCRLGSLQVPAAGVDPGNHVEVWLVDDADPALNQHLKFVLTDTVDVVRQLRSEGRRVLLHCVQAQSRTPTVGALYSVTEFGLSAAEAVAAMRTVLPESSPQAFLTDAVAGLADV